VGRRVFMVGEDVVGFERLQRPPRLKGQGPGAESLSLPSETEEPCSQERPPAAAPPGTFSPAHMIHYHVWFNLRPGVSEDEGLATMSRFLDELQDSREAVRTRLLVNNGQAPRSKLPRFHALIEFRSDAHLGEAMKRQASKGIHHGLHGAITRVVTDFHVEVFTLLEKAGEALHLKACEI
jgi:hypothetical protein